ncbi:MAG: LacI family transcriptional regulator [Sphingobacteriales bacterium 41-5]|nr:MAG: LacI family transcriptional regulator [Niabella sp. SCN 42-15]OJU27994.1 MAG: LacI family transcriptional regulator [Sphingobacteriales bacterium 41-5]
MKFEAITIKDIAKALGLSPSTVSRALRDSYEIGEDTKKKVQDYARENNYRPNPAALSLKEKRTRSIGIVVAEIANSFFSQIIDGVESVAYNKGYNVIITQSKESVEKEKQILEYLTSRSVDGVIISVSAETDEFSQFSDLKDRGMHIVFVDRISSEIDSHKVTVDNNFGAYQATKHLIENGCKNIAVICNNLNLSITQERIAGCEKALNEKGMRLKKDQIKYCNYGRNIQDEVEKALDQLFKQKNKPDGVVSLSDRLSTEIIRYLNLKGIKIPEQVALIGFSNSKNTELLNPSLSVIQQPAFEMGQTAANFLLQMIESKRPVTDFESRVLTPEIITRKSSGKK